MNHKESEIAYQDSLNDFKFQSIKKLFIPALIVYLLISFTDASSIPNGNVGFFFAIRLIFSIPYMMIYFFREKLDKKYTDVYGFLLFYSFSLGISVVSYFLGGAESTYYFGVLIVSFTQFFTVPFSRNKTIIYELLILATYFGINVIPFDIPGELLGKQVSNYISFAVIKILVAERFKKQMIQAYENKALKRKLKEKESVQSIFGELCHLLNNPLFISNTSLKKALKKDNKDELILKALNANERINLVAKELVKLQEGKDQVFEDVGSMRKYLNERQFSLKGQQKISK